jgi:hypothetical protein
MFSVIRHYHFDAKNGAEQPSSTTDLVASTASPP